MKSEMGWPPVVLMWIAAVFAGYAAWTAVQTGGFGWAVVKPLGVAGVVSMLARYLEPDDYELQNGCSES